VAGLIFRGRVLTPDGEAWREVTVTDGVVAEIRPFDRLRAHHQFSPDERPEPHLMRPEPVEGPSTVIDLADDEILLPGLVDTHVHINEPGRTDWEGFATATAAAAAGGVTTLLDMPLNSIPATTTVEALEVKRAAARGQCAVDVGFWAGAVPDSLGRLAELHDAGVFGFKCFLVDSGVPEFPSLSTGQLHQAMTEIAAFDGLLIVHAEDPELIAAHAGAGSVRYADFLASRPAVAETTAIDTVIAAARETGCRTHLVHLSSAEALPAIAAAKAEGVRLTAETCPHYLALHAEDIADGQTQFKCCPPVREAANADRLWAGLSEGLIDFVVSDHSPCPAELKRLDAGDFGLAWGGISSVQLGLPVVWTEARRRGHSLAEVVLWMADNPAAHVGVTGKGGIGVGRPADLVVFAPDASFVVDAAALRQKNPLTPYQGRTLDGVVRQTYLRGERVVPDQRPRGDLLTRT
jgi:allantoinase